MNQQPQRMTPGSRRVRKLRPLPEEGGAAVVVGRYRYSLTRWWRLSTGGRVAWVMLNPSTADALEDDPTIRRVQGFSEEWGFSSFEVVNLFAYRATDPAHLFNRSRKVNIVGPQNRDYLRQAVLNADRVVVAWGAAKDPRVLDQATALKDLFRAAPHRALPRCLGVTKSGAPRHPLYLKGNTEPIRWPGVTAWPAVSYTDTDQPYGYSDQPRNTTE